MLYSVLGALAKIPDSPLDFCNFFRILILARNAIAIQMISLGCILLQGEDVKPVVGDLVAAPFSEDNSWYRARILGVVRDDVDVYFVDYGDSLLVSKKAIRKLRYSLDLISYVC